MPTTPPDALVLELRQRLTAAMLQAGLLIRTDSHAELSVRSDALEHEAGLISVLAEALVARDGRNDGHVEPDGLTALVRVERIRRPATLWPAGLTGLDGAACARTDRTDEATGARCARSVRPDHVMSSLSFVW